MVHKRQLQLRDWLLSLLEVNSIPGLEWVDRDKQIFGISWRHGRKKGWASDTDSKLFKEWAVYKKRYQPGDDGKNAKLWKSRFRCALNALRDIRELKPLSKTRGDNAKKIYQFLQKPEVRLRSLKMAKTDDCGYNTCVNVRQELWDSEGSILDAINHNNENPSDFLGPNFCDAMHWPYMKTCRRVSEEKEWFFYEKPQEVCTSFQLVWTLNEEDDEANKTIEDFLTPKHYI